MRIFLIQLVDSCLGKSKQRLIAGKRFLARVGKIGQQAEVQTRVAIGETPDFERLDQILDVANAGEHRRNDHQRPRVRRNACRIIHPW